MVNGTSDYPGEKQIFGPGINVDPNSPDGQINNIFAQAKLDVLELIQQVNANFDPAQAIGVFLDRVGSYTAVKRRAGTYTIINVDVTATQALTLTGISTDPNTAFTVSDSSGNLYQLRQDYTFTGAGTQTLAFQSAVLGTLDPLANTLTIIQTVTLGISAVNNPGVATTVGTNEETDYAYRLRIQQTVSRASVGYVASLDSVLYALDGVNQVAVWENDTGTTDANGVPGHSVWVIVDFAAPATNDTIAQAIYSKRHAGTGQKGGISVNVLQADGTYFAIKFDTPTAQNLWISFNVAAITGTVDTAYIRNQILANVTYGINQTADATAIVSYVKSIAPNASVTSQGVSTDGITYAATVNPTTVNNQFQTAAARIIINGSPG